MVNVQFLPFFFLSRVPTRDTQAVQQHVAALLQRLHSATSTAAGAALDLKSAAHTAELDAEQLRQEIIARNQADKGNGVSTNRIVLLSSSLIHVCVILCPRRTQVAPTAWCRRS